MSRIARGDYYEDCRYHPVLCISADYKEDELVGVSLITGYVGSCSPTHCGVVPLTVEQAINRKVEWNEFAEKHGLPNPYPRDGWFR